MVSACLENSLAEKPTAFKDISKQNQSNTGIILVYFLTLCEGQNFMELNPLYSRLEDYQARNETLRGYL